MSKKEDFVVRVRSREGMVRLSLTPNSTLSVVREKVAEKFNEKPSNIAIALDSKMECRLLDDSLTLTTAGISHGMMIFADYAYKAPQQEKGAAKGAKAAAAAVAAAAAASTTTAMDVDSTATAAVATAMDDDDDDADVERTLRRCLHGSSMVCTNCMGAKKRDDAHRLAWLCQHAPDARCINCSHVNKGENVAHIAQGECTHPDSMKCPRCLPVSAAAAAAATTSTVAASAKKSKLLAFKAPSAPDRSRCKHGTHAMCTYCLPQEDVRLRHELPPRPECSKHSRHGSCTACLEWLDKQKLRIKRQPEPFVNRLSLDTNAGQLFTNYVIQTRFQIRRVAFMYGRVKRRSGTVVVEAIYEPPQTGTATQFALLQQQQENDAMGERVDALAHLLGWQCVGWCFSTAADFNAHELRLAAAFQAKYGEHFVTLVVKKSGEAASVEAFQASDQAVTLHVRQQLAADDDEQQRATPRALQLRASEGASAYVTHKEVTSIPIEFLQVPVPIVQRTGAFASNFPVANRPNEPPPSADDLRDHLQALAALPFAQRIKDFHCLLYLATLLDMEVDMPVLCDCVRRAGTKEARADDAQILQGYELIINSAAGIV